MKALQVIWCNLIVVLGLLTMVSCQKMTISNDLAGFDPDGNLPLLEVRLTGPGQAAGERIMDISNAKLFTLAEATEVPEEADFIILWSSSTGMNLVSPIDIDRLNGWNAGKTVNETWLVKNTTYFIRLEASEEHQKIYDGVKRAEELKPAYENAEQLTKSQENYDKNSHGPSVSIRNLVVGDILFIKNEKGAYGVARVNDIATGTSGSLTLSFKLDVRNAVGVSPMDPAEKIDMYETLLNRPGSNNGIRFLDISTGETYIRDVSVPQGEQAINNQEKIDLFFGRSSAAGNGLFNLVSMDDEERLDLFGMGKEVTKDWLVKNESSIIKLDASDFTDSLFLHTYTKSKLHDAYAKALEVVGEQDNYNVDVHGKGGHISEIEKGDLLFIKSESKNVLAMVKVVSHSSGTAGSMGLSVKVDNSENIETFPSPYVLKRGELTFGGWSAAGPEGDTYHIDLANITRLNTESADANQESVDFLNLWTGSGFANFIAPATYGSGWGGANRIPETWEHINSGVFVHQLAATSAELTAFDNLVNRDQLVQAFEDAEANIANRTDYDAGTYGPAGRVRRMDAGSIVYFKSTTEGRDLYAAMKIISLVPGSSNGREVIKMQVKSNLLKEE